jgi:hypothetical protein
VTFEIVGVAPQAAAHGRPTRMTPRLLLSERSASMRRLDCRAR